MAFPRSDHLALAAISPAVNFGLFALETPPPSELQVKLQVRPKKAGAIWAIVTDEEALTELESVEGQFPTEESNESIRTDWVDLKLPKREHPVSHWMSGSSDTFSFVGVMHARHAGEDISDRYEALKQFIRVHPKLGRPPRVIYVCGEFWFRGAIVEINGEYDRQWTDGRLKHVRFTVHMRSIGETDEQSPIDSTKPPHLSRYRIVKDGDDYEQIAKDEYGDPRLGVFLRQDHDFAFPEPGEIVFLPDREHFVRRLFAPDSYLLGAHDPVVTALQTLANKRGISLTVAG